MVAPFRAAATAARIDRWRHPAAQTVHGPCGFRRFLRLRFLRFLAPASAVRKAGGPPSASPPIGRDNVLQDPPDWRARLRIPSSALVRSERRVPGSAKTSIEVRGRSVSTPSPFRAMPVELGGGHLPGATIAAAGRRRPARTGSSPHLIGWGSDGAAGSASRPVDAAAGPLGLGWFARQVRGGGVPTVIGRTQRYVRDRPSRHRRCSFETPSNTTAGFVL